MAKASDAKSPLFIVEDEETWAASLRGKLKGKYDVHHFVSGEEALEQMAAQKPSIVVLDYHLEGQLTGLDTLREMMKLQPNVKVIMFTAQDDVQIALNILNSGAYDYVVKGENALNRLKIITRNLEEREALESQVYNMSIRVRRERFWMSLLVAGILIGSLIIYLNTCPSSRPIKWDPFGVEQDGKCTTYDNTPAEVPGLGRGTGE